MIKSKEVELTFAGLRLAKRFWEPCG